ncbi:MAG: type I-MYXAN CRISPR-associated protein Cas5/Cmx5/DevS [Cyanobacteria bacterium P01_A01_bin.83]
MTIILRVDVPIASFPTSRSREYRETYPLSPPSTVYGMLLSLVGETDRYKHCGVKIAIALLSEPAKSVTFRTMRRFRYKQLNHIKNSRPDFQEILTGIELIIWVDKGEDKAKPNLSDRITQAFANPTLVSRFGALCLGESRDFVNSVDLITEIEPNRSMKFLIQHESGYLSLPYWSDHVSSKNTRWLRYCFESSRQQPPDSAWTVIKAIVE